MELAPVGRAWMELAVKENIPLKKFTTFQIGGNARFFFSIKNPDDLREAVTFAKQKTLPIFVLGGGSNVLISDNGFPGVVIKMENRGIEFHEGRGEVKLEVAAGEIWDDVVLCTVSKNLSGIENLSGIPGLVGASPMQNIGAYGTEVSDVLEGVEVFDTESEKTKIFSNGECQFSYRDSFFKSPEGKRFIITKVFLKLSPEGPVNLSYPDLQAWFPTGSSPQLSHIRDAVLSIRRKKFPDLSQYGTAGSFFKNPTLSQHDFSHLRRIFPDIPGFLLSDGTIKVPAAYLIEHSGNFKGVEQGPVGVWKNHALVLVHFGGGSAKEIQNLALQISKCVKEKTHIDLEWEITLI